MKVWRIWRTAGTDSLKVTEKSYVYSGLMLYKVYKDLDDQQDKKMKLVTWLPGKQRP